MRVRSSSLRDPARRWNCLVSEPLFLRDMITRPGVVQVMAAHSPLSARLVEEAGFDGIWASGFELSALFGLPDASLLTMTQHLDMVRAMADECTLPLIADIDTGFGNALNVLRAVSQYERAGAAAVVMEDKVFPKASSLLHDARHDLVRTEEFAGKIHAALDARQSDEFLIIARTEALIAGCGLDEALTRAHAYDAAGADMILVHSKHRSPAEITAFVAHWESQCPLVIVPTTYPQLTAAEVVRMGKVKMIIFGNHAIRASVQGMRRAFAKIRADGGALLVGDDIATVQDIFRLQRVAELSVAEATYLR
jgi:phosphoenolpyruvate phosphomutase